MLAIVVVDSHFTNPFVSFHFILVIKRRNFDWRARTTNIPPESYFLQVI